MNKMKPGNYILPLTLMLIVSLTVKSQTTNKPPSWVGISIGSTKEGISGALISEYSTIVSKYGTSSAGWWKDFEKNISTEDRNRLQQIFKQMNAGQQAKQKVAFIQRPQPLKKQPSEKALNSWKDANAYGIWINGKKVDNAVLAKYKNTDFDQATVSKLYGAAKQNKKYSYQVDLMTKDYYHNHFEQTIAKDKIQMVFRDDTD
jgi:bla regulator protein BlaR1